VIASVMLMIDQGFLVGDRIEIQGLGTWGVAVEIGLRSTRLHTRDNRLLLRKANAC
jgi:small-conductance mechanosensitive channel